MQLTIFTAPKPFTNPHIATIQRNAIQSWRLLENAQVMLVGQEEGLAEVAAELGLLHLPEVSRNEQGTPRVSSIFELARQHSDTPLLAYVNTDVILLPDFVWTVWKVAEQAEQFLVVGQRWDLDLRQEVDFTPGWESRLRADLRSRGRLHPPGGSDYFVFPRSGFTQMPNFAIGRAGWDNWMFYHARQQHWPVVDATQAITAVHQDHDYSHLPGGQPHYRLPETGENIRLAGGRRAIFTLLDADCTLVEGHLHPIPRRGKKFWREVEIFPLVTLRSTWLGEVFFAFFHPIKAFHEWRGRLYRFLRHTINKRT
jgi:hypothetical protein